MALFQRRLPKRIPEVEQRLGLCVPPLARIICDPVTGEIIYDELREMERQDRMRGRPIIEFIEDESDKPVIMRPPEY